MSVGQRVAVFAGAVVMVVGVVLGMLPYNVEDPERSWWDDTYEADCRGPWLELAPDGTRPRDLPPITDWDDDEVERDLTAGERRQLDKIRDWEDRRVCGADAAGQLAIPVGLIVIGAAAALIGWFLFAQDKSPSAVPPPPGAPGSR